LFKAERYLFKAERVLFVSATEEIKELRQKIAGMKSIDPAFDAGNGVTLVAALAMLANAEGKLEDFNQSIATADDKDNIFVDANKEVRGFNKKVLPAAGLKYGTDSSEYEQLGGVRDSERKKRTPKPKPATP
jgi:hypothetical protein